MSFLNIKVTTKKNGTQQAWFKDSLGRRVGTRVGIDQAGRDSWVKAEQLGALASLYIDLQQEQLDRALGSDGSPMPPLKVGQRKFAGRRNGVATFQNKPRNLYGPGINGHMRDDIRINYLDDRMAKISITRKSSRDKALANERRSPWWGLSPASTQKLAEAMAATWGGSVAEYLANIGLIDVNSYIIQLAKRLNFRSLARRAA